MKTPLILLAAILLLHTNTQAQWKSSNISLEASSHNFGTIMEDGGTLEHRFGVTNTGDTPLIIHRVTSTCVCIKLDWTMEPIIPGARGEVVITYNPSGRPGPFNHPITIFSNATEGGLVYSIQGVVNPRAKTEADLYRRRFGNLGLTSTNIGFSRIFSEETRVDSIGIYNFGSEPIEVSFDRVPDHVRIVSTPSKLNPSEKGYIVVTFMANKLDEWGFVVNRVQLILNTERPLNSMISINATIEEDFTKMSEIQLENAPRITFREVEMNFGELLEGDVAEHEFVFTNTGKSDLIIRRIRASCGCTTVAPDVSVIKPGQTSSLKASFRTQGFTGRQSKTVTVITNDPKNPTTSLRISGNVLKK